MTLEQLVEAMTTTITFAAVAVLVACVVLGLLTAAELAVKAARWWRDTHTPPHTYSEPRSAVRLVRVPHLYDQETDQ